MPNGKKQPEVNTKAPTIEPPPDKPMPLQIKNPVMTSEIMRKMRDFYSVNSEVERQWMRIIGY